MKTYIAIVTEKTSPDYDKIIGNTKVGSRKGMNKEEFTESVKNSTCWTFEIKEI